MDYSGHKMVVSSFNNPLVYAMLFGRTYALDSSTAIIQHHTHLQQMTAGKTSSGKALKIALPVIAVVAVILILVVALRYRAFFSRAGTGRGGYQVMA